jgi:release factor glutamine methyltransferase
VKPLLEVLQSSAEWLRGRGTESPRLNAEHLLAHVLGKRRLDLYLEFDRPLGEGELAPLRDLLRRRAAGEPLQHLLGTAEFCGRTFACDRRALVPRPETEELVERVVERFRAAPPAGMVVDVGTGSGVIVISLALAFPELALAAVDLSPEALALACENGLRHGVVERIRWLAGDLLAPCDGVVGAVVANLPYIASADLAGLSPEVRRDPVLALDGGADGLGPMARLVGQAAARLEPGGLLALEIGDGQGAALKGLLAAEPWLNVEVQRDLQGRERFVFATHG